MRTLVLSDLHLGGGSCPNLFAGARALPAMLDRVAASPTRLVLNGDTFDFLALEGALHSNPEQTMRMLAEHEPVHSFLRTLAHVCARGGSVVVRQGEHDLALGDREVQTFLLRQVSVLQEHAERIQFLGPQATLLTVGDARVAITHDVLNQDNAQQRSLALHFLNPLRRQFGVGLADLLRPNYTDAVAAALAVNPTAARMTFTGAREAHSAASRRDSTSDLRLSQVFERFMLTAHERELLGRAIDPRTGMGMSPADFSALEHPRRRILEQLISEARARATDDARRLDSAEWSAAREIARSLQASAVVFGHTRSAGWRSEDSLVALDVGSWAWQLDLSAARERKSGLDVWRDTYDIDPEQHPELLRARFTAALIEPVEGKRTQLSLIEWRADQGLVYLHQDWLV